MKKFIYILSLVTLFSCEAPHENPLDPFNGTSQLTHFYGSVVTISFPREKISEALIIWRNENKSVLSDRDGEFSLEISKKVNGWLVCQKEGFFPDSVFIDWGKFSGQEILFSLNQKTTLQDFSMITSVVFFNDSTQSQTMIINVNLADRDKDIDSVALTCGELNFRKELLFNTSTGMWTVSVTPFDFEDIVSFEQAVGKEFDVFVRDYNGREITLIGGGITRVITLMPVLLSPREDETVQVPFTVSWEKYPAQFEFTYKIQIYRNEVPPQLVFEKANIEKSQTEISVENDLPQSNYMCTLEVKDEYGNKVRSKPNAFKIEN